MNHCCDKFKEMAGGLCALAGGGFLNPPETMPNAQFEPDTESPTWNINGCCGGGCFVVTQMRFCPYCGQRLSHPLDEGGALSCLDETDSGDFGPAKPHPEGGIYRKPQGDLSLPRTPETGTQANGA